MKQTNIANALRVCALAAIVFIALTACSHSKAGQSGSVERINKEQLNAWLDNPDTTIIDVRSKRDWEKSDAKIPGAIRQSPSTEDMSWAARYPRENRMVLYCA